MLIVAMLAMALAVAAPIASECSGSPSRTSRVGEWISRLGNRQCIAASARRSRHAAQTGTTQTWWANQFCPRNRRDVTFEKAVLVTLMPELATECVQ